MYSRARAGSSSLLPTHMDPLHTPFSVNANYPPLAKTWARIRSWLSREYPELGDTLNYGILPQDLAQIEMQFGFSLPAVVRESYLCVDGQEAESSAGCSEGLFFGLTFLPLESVLEEWRFWREVDSDPATGANDYLRQSMQSIPPGWVRKEYSQRGWIPLIGDKAGNYLGIDLNPAEGGSVGQVIVFGRDFDTKVVLWNGDGLTGWAKWLAGFVDELESGDGFEIGLGDTSEGSEDEVGYESYYYDGHGRGHGDGGGDNGAGGGLRYIGEYRGWNVLEAWADRSLRKWHEAGVIADMSLGTIEEETNKVSTILYPSLNIFLIPVLSKAEEPDLVAVEQSLQGRGAEIPIPILSSSSEHIPEPTVNALNQPPQSYAQGGSSPKAPIPTISVTKPPAPRPVTLPTTHDISSESSLPEFDEDIETGVVNGMGDTGENFSLVTSEPVKSRSKSPIRRETSDASGSALPTSTPLELASSTPSVQTAIVPDLLADEPLVSISSPTDFDDLKTPTQRTDPDAPHHSEVTPDTTIRLVGGGGQVGSALEEAASQPEPETEAVLDSDVQSVTSATSSDASKPGEKKHKKSKSSLALKRLSQFASKRSDSTSSVKDTASVQ